MSDSTESMVTVVSLATTVSLVCPEHPDSPENLDSGTLELLELLDPVEKEEMMDSLDSPVFLDATVYPALLAIPESPVRMDLTACRVFRVPRASSVCRAFLASTEELETPGLLDVREFPAHLVYRAMLDGMERKESAVNPVTTACLDWLDPLANLACLVSTARMVSLDSPDCMEHPEIWDCPEHLE